MALSYITREADGVQSQFDFPFGYISKSHIFVFVNNSLVAFKWISDFLVEPISRPLAGQTVTIRRLTDRANRVTTYTDGQTLLAESLNAGDLQTFFIAQEMIDQVEEGIVAGDVSVINPGSGYITAQWIQDQLTANLAAAPQFGAIDSALAAEAAARAAAILAEANARATEVLALTAADAEQVDRLVVLEEDLNTPTTGVKAKLVAVENLVVTETSARVAADEALQAEIDDPSTGLKARATSLESRVTTVETDKASASELDALEAVVTNPTTGLTTKASQASLTELATTVNGKASASELDALEAVVLHPSTGLATKASQTSLTDLQVVVGQKADATAVTSLSAEVASQAASIGDALNANPKLAQRFDGTAIAPGWSDWANGGGTSYAHPSLPTRFGFRETKTAAQPVNKGQLQVLPVVPGRQYLIRATVRRLGGSFASSGVLVQWYNNSSLTAYFGDAPLRFSTSQTTNGEVAGSSPDGVTTWETIITAPAGAGVALLFQMTGWDGFGTSVDCDIVWYECGLYASDAPHFRAAKARADIITESAARVSGDSANATTIETNRAQFNAQELYPNLIVDDFGAGAPYWVAGWGGGLGAYAQTRSYNLPGYFQAGVTNVAWMNVAMPVLGTSQVADSHVYSPGGSSLNEVKVSPGERLYLSALVAGHRCQSLTLHVMYRNSSGGYLTDNPVGGPNATTSDPLLVQDATGGLGANGGLEQNFVRLSGFVTVPANAAFATMFIRMATRFDQGSPYLFWARPMMCKVPASFTGEIPWSKQAANVAFLREALATGSSSRARLMLAVNTATNVATIEAVAQEGEGTWNGSKISFTADTIELNGNVLVNGSVLEDKIANNAITQAFTDSTDDPLDVTDQTWTSLASVALTVPANAKVLLQGFAFHQALSNGGSALAPGYPEVALRIRRRLQGQAPSLGVLIRSQDSSTAFNAPGAFTRASQGPGTIVDTDDPVAGAYIYDLEGYIDLNFSGQTSLTRRFRNRLLSAVLFKK